MTEAIDEGANEARDNDPQAEGAGDSPPELDGGPPATGKQGATAEARTLARGTMRPLDTDQRGEQARTAAHDKARPASRFRRSVALVFAVDTYREGLPGLRSAVNDGRAIAAQLGDSHEFIVEARFESEATAQALMALLETRLAAELTAHDRLIVYFAGHGVAVDGEDGPAGYLMLAEAERGNPATYLGMKRFHDALAQLRCRHVLVILDCCFAGTFRWSSLRNVSSSRVMYRERYDRFVTSAAWQVLTSASADQVALDRLHGDRGEAQGKHSPFAAALLAALAGAADFTGDGLITASELGVYLRDQVEPSVEALGRAQTPQLFPLNRHERGEFVFQVPGRRLALPAAPALTEEQNPYLGLRAFEEKDAPRFFGRDEMIAALAAHVEQRRLTVVTGPSGAGKSSLVHAGLLPRLRARNGWRLLSSVRPGATPGQWLARWAVELGELATAEGGPAVVHETPDQRAAAAASGWAAALAALPGSIEHVVVVIDQLEELFTQGARATEVHAFLGALAETIAAEPRLHLIVTLRSDFEAQLAGSALAPWWQPGRFVVTPMGREELRQVIEGPAADKVLYFEPPSLVDRLIDDVGAAPAKLPLLSFALQELYRHFWHRRAEERAITEADYQQIGSVAASLTTRAERLYAELVERAPDDAAAMRHVLTRLITRVAGKLVRRSVPWRDFLSGDLEQDARVERVLHSLIEARLVVAHSETAGGHAGLRAVEPAHEELISGWPRLGGWTHEAGYAFGLRREVDDAAARWSPRREASLLWGAGPRLLELRALLAEPLHGLNSSELAFGRASVRRRRRQLATIGTSISLALGAIVVTVVVALVQRTLARERLQAGYQSIGGVLAVIDHRLEELPGAREAKLALVEETSKLVAALVPEPERDPTARRFALSTRVRRADDAFERGEVEPALRAYDAAVAVADALQPLAEPSEWPTISMTYVRAGTAWLRRGGPDGDERAAAYFRRALAVLRREYELAPGSEMALALATPMSNLAEALRNLRQLDESERLHREELALLERWAPHATNLDVFKNSIAQTLAALGDLHLLRKQRTEASRSFERAAEVARSMSANSGLTRRRLLLDLELRRISQRPEDAACLSTLRELVRLLLLERSHDDRRRFQDWTSACRVFPAAHYEAARGLAEELGAESAGYEREQGQLRVSLGYGLLQGQRYQDAQRELEAAMPLLEGVVERDAADTMAREALLKAYQLPLFVPGISSEQAESLVQRCLTRAVEPRWREARVDCLLPALDHVRGAAAENVVQALSRELPGMAAAEDGTPMPRVQRLRAMLAVAQRLPRGDAACADFRARHAELDALLATTRQEWAASGALQDPGVPGLAGMLRLFETMFAGLPSASDCLR